MSERSGDQAVDALQYDRLIDCGVFQPGDRIEPVGGELIVREPQRTSTRPPSSWLLTPCGPRSGPAGACGFSSRGAGRRIGAGARHRRGAGISARLPADVILEARADPGGGRILARPGSRDQGQPRRQERIADYWIVNLVDEVLEVYRDPVADPASLHGWRYASVTIAKVRRRRESARGASFPRRRGRSASVACRAPSARRAPSVQ